MRPVGVAILAALFILACRRWRRGYQDEAAERDLHEARQMARHTEFYIVDASRWIGSADPFYDDDGDGSGGTAA
jgi:hypothetical protein